MTTEDIEAIKRYVEAKCAATVAEARGVTPCEFSVRDATELLDSMAEDK